MHLVIGGNGLIGTALCAEIRGRGLPCVGTSRRQGDLKCIPHDLRITDPDWVPNPAGQVDGTVYLVAAIVGFGPCETNPESWMINVDGPIMLARLYKDVGAFIVFISSDVVEMPGAAAYQIQKRQVEAYIHSIDGAIIRPSKVAPERAGELAKVIVDVGLARKPGVTRWS